MMTTSSSTTITIKKSMLESRLRAALWGLFSGDALASPTHWYYGGFPQIQSHYGPSGITTYTKPIAHLPGSILNKSNTNGGGRGSYTKKNGISIIGDVINHGKYELWDPRRSVHYHATLQAGENTLEVQLVRVLMKSIVATSSSSTTTTEGTSATTTTTFSPAHFLNAYVHFMTTPNSHNDTYASTCHRMFFANRVYHEKEWKDCPDNDYHNVDAIDGLILPTLVSLASIVSSLAPSFKSNDDDDEVVSVLHENDVAQIKQKARLETAAVVSVTRRSNMLETVSAAWSDVVFDALLLDNGVKGNEQFLDSLGAVLKFVGTNRPPRTNNGRDEMSACYLSQSLPTAIDMMAKYTVAKENDVWTGLIANANVGGENVHRGALLGAILGARGGMECIPKSKLVDGLYDVENLEREIDDFVNVVIG